MTLTTDESDILYGMAKDLDIIAENTALLNRQLDKIIELLSDKNKVVFE